MPSSKYAAAVGKFRLRGCRHPVFDAQAHQCYAPRLMNQPSTNFRVLVSVAALVVCAAWPSRAQAQTAITIDCSTVTSVSGGPTGTVFSALGGSFSITLSTLAGCGVMAINVGSGTGMVVSAGSFSNSTASTARCNDPVSFTVTAVVLPMPEGAAPGSLRATIWNASLSGPSGFCQGADGINYSFTGAGGASGSVIQRNSRPKFQIRTKSACMCVRG